MASGPSVMLARDHGLAGRVAEHARRDRWASRRRTRPRAPGRSSAARPRRPASPPRSRSRGGRRGPLGPSARPTRVEAVASGERLDLLLTPLEPVSQSAAWRRASAAIRRRRDRRARSRSRTGGRRARRPAGSGGSARSGRRGLIPRSAQCLHTQRHPGGPGLRRAERDAVGRECR